MKEYKDIKYRCNELKTSLDQIKDIYESFILKNKAHNINLLAGIARMLLCRGTNAHPLLLEIMNEFKIQPIIYSFPEQTNPHLIHSLYNDISWGVVPRPNLNIPYLFEKWLNIPAYVLSIDSGIQRFNRIKLIKHIADKHGGAHYDRDISPLYDNLSETYISVGKEPNKRKMTGIQLFLLDISMAIHYIGYYTLNARIAQQNCIPEDDFQGIKELKNHYRYARITNINPTGTFSIIQK